MYVDGFVLAVPKNKLDDYKKLATLAGEVWKEHGALDYVEAVADDVKPGKRTSFPQSVKLKDDEVVVFAYIVYRSRPDFFDDPFFLGEADPAVLAALYVIFVVHQTSRARVVRWFGGTFALCLAANAATLPLPVAAADPPDRRDDAPTMVRLRSPAALTRYRSIRRGTGGP